MGQLRFKQGLYEDINNLQNGDLGFALLNNKNENLNEINGTLVLKENGILYHLMPAPGNLFTENLPLISTGGSSPRYEVLSILGGGTGATNAQEARENLGIPINSILAPKCVLISDDNGMIISSEITSSELFCLKGVKKNIQDQIDQKAAVTIISWGEQD